MLLGQLSCYCKILSFLFAASALHFSLFKPFEKIQGLHYNLHFMGEKIESLVPENINVILCGTWNINQERELTWVDAVSFD